MSRKRSAGCENEHASQERLRPRRIVGGLEQADGTADAVDALFLPDSFETVIDRVKEAAP